MVEFVEILVCPMQRVHQQASYFTTSGLCDYLELSMEKLFPEEPQSFANAGRC